MLVLVSPSRNVVRLDIVLLLLWHLWKARNSMVFDQVDSSPCDIINRVCRDIDAWMCRYKKYAMFVRELWRAWLGLLTSP